MPKQNAMLAKIEAKYAAEYAVKLAEAHANFQHMLRMALQQSHDAALMAIDDVFDVNAYSTSHRRQDTGWCGSPVMKSGLNVLNAVCVAVRSGRFVRCVKQGW